MSMSGREFKRIMRALYMGSHDNPKGFGPVITWRYECAHYGDGKWSMDFRDTPNGPDDLPEDFGGEYRFVLLDEAARLVTGTEVIRVHRFSRGEDEYVDGFDFDLVSRAKLPGLREQEAS